MKKQFHGNEHGQGNDVKNILFPAAKYRAIKNDPTKSAMSWHENDDYA